MSNHSLMTLNLIFALLILLLPKELHASEAEVTINMPYIRVVIFNREYNIKSIGLVNNVKASIRSDEYTLSEFDALNISTLNEDYLDEPNLMNISSLD